MAFSMTHHRLRSGDTVALSSNTDWDSAEDADPSFNYGVRTRLRVRIYSDSSATNATFKLQRRHNAGTWYDVYAGGIEGNFEVDRVNAANSAIYNDGDSITAGLLSGSNFINGQGVGNDNVTGTITFAANDETELEFCFVIRKLFNENGEGSPQWGANAVSDTIELRVVEGDGTVFTGSYVTPTITLTNNPNLIGGVYAETSSRQIIATAEGILYYFGEHGHYSAPIIPAIMKSTDGGVTWVPQDDGLYVSGPDGWPSSNRELESADLFYDPGTDRIYIGWQGSTDPYFRIFNTSGHASPDQFAIGIELPEDLTTTTDQSAAIVYRSDGTVVMFYAEHDGTDQTLAYNIRSSGGSWGTPQVLENESGFQWEGVRCCLGASDLIHIVYGSTSNFAYYRNLNSSDTLSGRTQLVATDANREACVCKPVYWDDGGTEKVMLVYLKASDNLLYSRIVTSGSVGSESASAIVDNTVLSDQASSHSPTAYVVVDPSDDTIYVLYSDLTTHDIYMTKSVNGASFDTDVEIFDAVDCTMISAELFTHNAGNGGAKVIGIAYEDPTRGPGPTNSPGYTGATFYDEYQLAAGGIVIIMDSA